MSDNGVMLSLEFENFPDFTSEWQVYKLEEGVIKLYKDGGNRIVLKNDAILRIPPKLIEKHLLL